MNLIIRTYTHLIYAMSLNKIFDGAKREKSHDAALEIEIKYLIDPRGSYPGFVKIGTEAAAISYAKSIIDAFKKTKARLTIEETINFIENAPINTIKQLVFHKGVQVKEKKNFYTKRSLASAIYLTGDRGDSRGGYNQRGDRGDRGERGERGERDSRGDRGDRGDQRGDRGQRDSRSDRRERNDSRSDPPMKISISEEKKISETDIRPDLVRAKLRLSISPTDGELKRWRIDITLTKTLKKIASIAEITKIRDGLFPAALTLDGFSDAAPWRFADAIELEIESTDPESVSEETLAAMIAEFGKITKPAEPIAKASDNLQEKFYELAEILMPHAASSFKPPNTRGFKSLTNNVVELTKQTWLSDLNPNLENYLITDKADGFRVLLHLHPKRGIATAIDSRGATTFSIPKCDVGECLADAEMIGLEQMLFEPENKEPEPDNEASESAHNFLIFDTMMYDDENVSAKDFIDRKNYISNIVKLSPNLFEKIFIEANNIANAIEEVRSRKKPFEYNTDGIIFTEKTGNYAKTKSYKWKSVEDTTIDFLIRACPKSLLGIEPYTTEPNQTLYCLFSGIDSGVMRKLNIRPIKNYKELFPRAEAARYMPIQFSPSSNPYAYLFRSDQHELDNKIVEMHYDTQTESWRLHKIRDDKTRDAEHGIAYGNDFRVAELVWQNYFNPITIEDFKMTKEEGLASVYFKDHDVAEYKAMRSYNSFVKEMLFNPYHGVSWAIDLGSGKGQDLFRYTRAGIQNVLFADLDRMALDELINRKYAFALEKPKSFQPKSQSSHININILEIDLNSAYTDVLLLIKRRGYPLPSGGVPLIICNLAIHYFVGTEAMRTNFANLVKGLLAPGGRFIFTTFDGQKVFDLVNAADGKWDKTENGKLKYSIHADYHSATFTGNSQKIKVLQPFSDSKYYSEYLVSHALLQKTFKSLGMTREIFESFDIYQKAFQSRNKAVSDQLTPLDAMYSSLYTISSYHNA